VAGGGDERERNKTQKKKAKIVNQTNWRFFGKGERNTEKNQKKNKQPHNEADGRREDPLRSSLKRQQY